MRALLRVTLMSLFTLITAKKTVIYLIVGSKET